MFPCGSGQIPLMADESGKLDRRGFFTQGLQRALREAVEVFSERVAPVRYQRPPGALPEPAFLAACTRCGNCSEVCPVHAITKLAPNHGLAGGTPVLDVAVTACIMCETMPCAAACPTPALEVPAWGWRDAQVARLEIDTARCITYRDVECGICARVCPVGEDALRMDERGRPVIGAACTGCGQCVNACVTTPSSITAAPLEMLA
jgi:ferredoxin-type protein NapG